MTIPVTIESEFVGARTGKLSLTGSVETENELSAAHKDHLATLLSTAISNALGKFTDSAVTDIQIR